jgi:hypothetical protein
MRLLLALVIVTGCSVGERRSEPASPLQNQAVVRGPLGVDHSAQGVQAQSSTPVESVQTNTTVTDSSFVGLTPLSDSITHIGSGRIDDTYGAFDYIKNGIEYASIVHDIGTKPDGQPLWGIVSTVFLPPMDSTEHLMFSGLCGADYKSDPYVLAVVGAGGDSVYRNIRKAWRFDRQAKTLREIPTKNVVCFDPMGQD